MKPLAHSGLTPSIPGGDGPKTVADILTAAADMIGPGHQWAPRRAGVDAFSTFHTISMASGCRSREAVEYFARFLGWSGDSTPHRPEIDWLNYEWDCAPERTQAEVVAALRAAAEKARTPAPANLGGDGEAVHPEEQK